MGNLINKATGEREYIDDADLPSAIASGKYNAPDVVPINRFGRDTYTTPNVAEGEKTYSAPSTGAKAEAAHGENIRRVENSGIVGAGKALVGGTVSGGTGGLLDPFQDAQEFNRGFSTAGQLAGALLPGFFGDEAGVGAAIAKDGVAAERATAGLSSKFLYGGELGHDVGTTGRAIERGLSGAGRDVDALNAAAAAPEDLANLDAKGLRAARDTELDQLSTAQAADRATQKSSVVDEMLAYRKDVKDANPWLVIDQGEDASRLNKANKALRNALDDEKGLRDAPGMLAKPLRVEEKALENTIANRQEIAAKLDAVNQKIARDVGAELEAGSSLGLAAGDVELTGKAAKRYASWADVKLGKEATLTVDRDAAQGFVDALQSGEIRGASQQALDRLDGLLDANRALQQKIASAVAPLTPKAELTSARLKAIEDARDALTTPKSKSLLEDMLGGTVMGHVSGALAGLPIIGPAIGAKVGRAVSDAVFGRMGKGLAESGKRTAAAVGKFLDTGKRAAPTLTLAATKILSNVAYGPSSPATAKAKDLPSLYKARAAELKSQTMYGPTGAPVMRPEARERMAQQALAAVRAGAPQAADRMETIAARRVEFLASKLAKRPDYVGVQTGPDNWHPSDMEMRTFARYAHAVEDPHGVEERLADGTVSPEDAEAYRSVYPERFEALKQDVISKLPLLQKTLPYGRRIALSIFTGVAVDPSLHPAVLALLQSQFAGEDGSSGGTQAPTPQPQFGSVRADIGTASQQREARMR